MATGLPVRALATADQTPAIVRVSHDDGDQHASPCLAVNPRDPRNLLAACMLTSGDVATYASFDGGRSWQSSGPLPLPKDIDGAATSPPASMAPAAASCAGS